MRKAEINGSLIYFLYFAAQGTIIPIAILFFQKHGLSLEQATLVLVICRIVGFLAGPVWAVIADVFQIHKKMLPIALALCVPSILMLNSSYTFVSILFFYAMYSFSNAPIISLTDNAVLNLLGKENHRYGIVRLWGSVGWSVSVFATGFVLQNLGYQFAPWMYAFFFLFAILISLQMPATKLTSKVIISPGSFKLFLSRRWIGLLFTGLASGLGGVIIINYLAPFLKNMGVAEGMIGISLTAASVSEIPFFLFMPQIMKRLSPEQSIRVSLVLMAIRCSAYGIFQNATAVFFIQLLHGFSYGLYWTAGVMYAQRIAPQGLDASSQALFGAFYHFLSGTIGVFIGGWMYQALGANVMFQFSAIMALVGLFVFNILNKPDLPLVSLQPQAE